MSSSSADVKARAGIFAKMASSETLSLADVAKAVNACLKGKTHNLDLDDVTEQAYLTVKGIDTLTKAKYQATRVTRWEFKKMLETMSSGRYLKRTATGSLRTLSSPNLARVASEGVMPLRPVGSVLSVGSMGSSMCGDEDCAPFTPIDPLQWSHMAAKIPHSRSQQHTDQRNAIFVEFRHARTDLMPLSAVAPAVVRFVRIDDDMYLSRAVVEAYKSSRGLPVTYEVQDNESITRREFRVLLQLLYRGRTLKKQGSERLLSPGASSASSLRSFMSSENLSPADSNLSPGDSNLSPADNDLAPSFAPIEDVPFVEEEETAEPHKKRSAPPAVGAPNARAGYSSAPSPSTSPRPVNHHTPRALKKLEN